MPHCFARAEALRTSELPVVALPGDVAATYGVISPSEPENPLAKIFT